jgi:integrating conjugative element membrane protein (TIGR03747 family)
VETHQTIFLILNTAFSVIEIQEIKLMLFLKSLPLMALVILLFVIDGLVQRDIRKFQCARESTYLFHRPKPILSFCFYVPLFIYCVIPEILNPQLLFVVMALILGLITHVIVKNFKKYL